MGRHGSVRRGAGLLAVGSIGLAVLMAVFPSDVSDAAQVSGLPAGSQYVALGDSYSAGYGIAPSTNVPVPGCQQSAENYPHQVAAALDLQLIDVTCTGAVTANIDTTPQVTTFIDGSPGGTAPLQNAVLSSDTRLVTLTIGGNDLQFASIAGACFALTDQGTVYGTAAPNFQSPTCEVPVEADPTLDPATNLPVVRASIARVLADIVTRAPNAIVLLLEYPTIAPTAANTPAAGCFEPAFTSLAPVVLDPDAFPFTDSDTPWLNFVQASLNQVIDEEGAAQARTVVVPTFAATDAFSACAPAGVQYVNGVTLTSLTVFPDPSFTEATGNLHPNATGVGFLTRQVLAAVAVAFPTPPPTTSTTSTTSTTPGGSTTTSTSTTTVVTTTVRPSSTAARRATGTLPATGRRDVGGTLVAGISLLVVGAGALLLGRRRDRPRDVQNP